MLKALIHLVFEQRIVAMSCQQQHTTAAINEDSQENITAGNFIVRTLFPYLTNPFLIQLVVEGIWKHRYTKIYNEIAKGSNSHDISVQIPYVM